MTWAAERAADGDALSVQEPRPVISCGRLEGVTKRMAQVEKGAIPLLGLVAHHDLGLHLDLVEAPEVGEAWRRAGLVSERREACR